MARGRYMNATRRRGRRRNAAPRGRAPLPYDAQAQYESAKLGNEAGDTRASLASNYAKAQSDLGFGLGADNPYSSEAENRRRLAADQRGILNTAGNQLYSGATANARSQAASRYDQREKAIQEKIGEAANAYNAGTAQVGREEQTGRLGIGAGAIERKAATAPQPLAVSPRRRRATRTGARRARGRGRL
jgi:hypothetical protein